jgi:hypothetical protein
MLVFEKRTDIPADADPLIERLRGVFFGAGRFMGS